MTNKFNLKYVCIYLLVILLSIITACSQKGLISERYSKKIYSVPGLMSDGPHDYNLVFIVYGDMRPGFRVKEKFLFNKNWYTWKMFVFPFYQIYLFGNGIIGEIEYLREDSNYGFKERNMIRDAVYGKCQSSQVDFILCTGDYVIDGRYPNHWMRFINENKVEHPLLNEIPYLPTIGGHEYYYDKTYGEKNYREIFQYPQFYEIEFLDAVIFVIDSNIIIDNKQQIDDNEQDELFEKWLVSGEESDNLSWLEKKLAASDKSFKIISMHHPVISFNEHFNDWRRENYGRDLPKKRKRLIGLFQKYGVQIVFCGHEHLYEHNIIRYAADEDSSDKELHIIITGGGGVPLRKKSGPEKIKKYLEYFREEGLDVIQVANQEIFHYCLVSIENDMVSIDVNEVTADPVKTVRVKEQIVIHKH